jgi:hypothetical protein
MTEEAAERDPQFGACDREDFVALDEAMVELRRADDALWAARARAGEVMRTMRAKGAQRKAIARLAAVSDQTVGNLAHGRKKKES